jgi:hypothetical protein
MMCNGLVRLMMLTSAARLVDFPDVREPERVEGRDLVGDRTKDGADGPALLEDVDTEAPDTVDHVGGVELFRRLEALPEVLGEDPVDHLPDLLVVEPRETLDLPQRAVHADARRQLVGKVKVRRPVLDRVGQQVVQVERARSTSGRARGLVEAETVELGEAVAGRPDERR